MVRVFSDEEIIRTGTNQRAEELPVRRGQILPFVDEQMVDDDAFAPASLVRTTRMRSR